MKYCDVLGHCDSYEYLKILYVGVLDKPKRSPKVMKRLMGRKGYTTDDV